MRMYFVFVENCCPINLSSLKLIICMCVSEPDQYISWPILAHSRYTVRLIVMQSR